MDSVDKSEDVRNTENRVKSLVRFLIATCFSKLNGQTPKRLENYKLKIKEMLNVEERQHRGEEEKYNYLRDTVDLFFNYVGSEEIVKKVQSGRISKGELEDDFLEDVINVPKRKYDMRDLYKPDLISSHEGNKDLKRTRVLLKKDGTRHIYTDEDGKKVILTDVGTIEYEEWPGMSADLSMYLLQKERSNGTFTQNIVCTKVIIANMEEPGYRDAVLKELFSDKNINRSNASSYIGQIFKRRKSNNTDLPKTEKQTGSEYTYRIDDNYVLEYDAAELTAVVEAARQYSRSDRRKSDSVIGKYNIGIDQTDRRKSHSEADGHDEPDGR